MKARREHPHLNPLPSRERKIQKEVMQGNLERGIHPHLSPLPSRERRLEKGVAQRKLCEEIEGGGIAPSPWSSPVEGEENTKGNYMRRFREGTP